MEYVKYGIYIGIIYFEDINKYKIRPILLMNDKGNYNFYDVFKITSQDKKYKYDYEIKKWKEAGLKEKSYIKLRKIEVIEKDFIKVKIGDLQKEDIEGMQDLLKEMKKDDEIANEKYNTKISNRINVPDEILDKLNDEEL